jgi:hypothetical protein
VAFIVPEIEIVSLLTLLPAVTVHFVIDTEELGGLVEA